VGTLYRTVSMKHQPQGDTTMISKSKIALGIAILLGSASATFAAASKSSHVQTVPSATYMDIQDQGNRDDAGSARR
jgi:hypothetical protein